MPINQFSPQGSWWTKAPMMDPTSKPTSSSKYKGVVPQPNGRWGAQIYENHHRVWLGTFDTQEAAALSYDRAATMFRGRDATLNFLPNQYLDQEQTMQDRDINIEEYETDETTVNHNIEDEHMFEKPLTPSDVGKLNRLVIPKQHAEKYFPLVGGDSGEKGLLLSFEDELEKPWRFRYSYWNSSQSYVLTKGWSRFVKEKRLDAGDVVFFERRRLDGGGDRFLIRWRRRVIPVQDSGVVTQVAAAETGGWTRVFYSAHPYPSHPPSTAPVYIHSEEPIVQTQTAPRNSNSKRLRLFGVNLDCQPDESEPATPNGLSFSSQGRDQLLYSQVNDGSNYFSHKDYNFTQDINQTRNSQ